MKTAKEINQIATEFNQREKEEKFANLMQNIETAAQDGKFFYIYQCRNQSEMEVFSEKLRSLGFTALTSYYEERNHFSIDISWDS